MKQPTQKDINPYINSDTNKRYYTYDYYLKHKFGGKVAKIPLDCGFTCPNIDGTKGKGGCIYCSDRGSGDFAQLPSVPLDTQYKTTFEMMKRKWKTDMAIPYFQAHTNTYADVEFLKKKYYEAMCFEGVVGINIATRPDCLPDNVVDLLCDIANQTVLTVELGLQSIHDSTGQLINRCHTYKDFLDGYLKLRSASDKIGICIHLIEGLPYETHDMMIETATEIASLRPDQVKLHALNILKNTPLEKMYAQGKYTPIDRDEYIHVVCDTLELLPPSTVIGRITGDTDRKLLIEPLWSQRKTEVINKIDQELFRRKSFQGKLYKHKSTE